MMRDRICRTLSKPLPKKGQTLQRNARLIAHKFLIYIVIYMVLPVFVLTEALAPLRHFNASTGDYL